MKFNYINLMQQGLVKTIKPISLAILLGCSANSSFAAEMAAVIDPNSAVNDAPEVYDNESWQSPAVTDFNKLDKSGNGLLLPNEASKGKAFNKKTFKQADTDNDGSIDVNEYVVFKTGKMPAAAKPASAATVEPVPEKPMPDAPAEAMPEETP